MGGVVSGRRAGRLGAAVCAAALLLVAAPAPALAADGGVNTGLPGSSCVADSSGWTYTAPTDPGISTTALGAGPAYYELGRPTSGAAPKGVMIVIHGGGWFKVGRAFVAFLRREADLWRDKGWATLNVTYRGCSAGAVDDIVGFHDLARAAFPGLPICATGQSAGGHLALMLAIRRPSVACVVSQGGPTDLVAAATDRGAAQIHHMAIAAFGAARLAELSPARRASEIRARVLLGHGYADRIVPISQAQRMDGAMGARYSDTVWLESGSEPWVHVAADPAALGSFRRREDNLVAPLTGDPPGECALCGAGAGWSRTEGATPSEVTLRNDLVTVGSAAKIGEAVATARYTTTSVSFDGRGANATLPAGRWRLATCWGAGYTTAFRQWSQCASREVTTSTTTTQSSPSRTWSFSRIATDYAWFQAATISRHVDGAWVTYARSWKHAAGSTIPVPPA